MSERKRWQRPQLVVLVRSQPEEVVLTACKTGTNDLPGGPLDADFRCVDFHPLSGCFACSGATAS